MNNIGFKRWVLGSAECGRITTTFAIFNILCWRLKSHLLQKNITYHLYLNVVKTRLPCIVPLYAFFPVLILISYMHMRFVPQVPGRYSWCMNCLVNLSITNIAQCQYRLWGIWINRHILNASYHFLQKYF